MKQVKMLFPIFIIFCNSLQAQFFSDELIVTASSLRMRESPGVDAKVLTSVPKGETLKLLRQPISDQGVDVDSMYGYWLNVSYKKFSGYIFSNYVANNYNIYYEGEPVDDKLLLPFFNWYGVYQTPAGDMLRKVTPRVEEQRLEEYDQTFKLLMTTNTESSRFLIATTKKLNEGPAGSLDSNYTAQKLRPDVNSISIVPRMVEYVNVGSEYFIQTTGCYQYTPDGIQLNNFQMLISDQYMAQPGAKGVQDISSIFDEYERDNIYLEWYGDIDQDQKPDAIISSCVEGCRFLLFLSSEAQPGEYLHLSAEHIVFGD